jgi:DNA-binding NarL/FixJ family response regulator
MSWVNRRRILLVDSQPVVRERLAELIRTEPDLCVCGEADNAAAAVSCIRTIAPDLVVLELALADRHGLELLKGVHSQYKKLAVLVFSFYSEELYAERAIRAGARGYLEKNRPTAELIAAIRRVLDGELHLSPPMLAKFAGRHLGQQQLSNGPVSHMSDRELEVFELIGAGHGPSKMASRLGVSVKTIETYCDRLKRKLCVPSAETLRQTAIRTLHSGRLYTILELLLPWVSLLGGIDIDLDLM